MVDRPRILVIGKNGQVGWELCRTLTTLGDLIPVDYPEIDLMQAESIRSVIGGAKPDIIVNAAAYTAVDKVEEEEGKAEAINGIALSIISSEAKRLGSVVVHYSTDYVYDGEKRAPYVETDVPNPLNVYGKTKLTGDLAIQAADVPYLIFRTSWVYGWRGHNFLLTMLKLSHEKDEIKVVDDQIGAPTWARNIAECTAQILSQGIKDFQSFFNKHCGIYNMTSSGSVSWYGFASAIFEYEPDAKTRKLSRLLPIATSEYPTLAKRPKYSVLDGTKLKNTFGLKIPEWNWPIKLWGQTTQNY